MAKKIQKSIFSIYLTGIVLAICLYFAMKPTEKVALTGQVHTIAQSQQLAKKNNKLQESPSNPSLSSKIQVSPIFLGIISGIMTCFIVAALFGPYMGKEIVKRQEARGRQEADKEFAELKNAQPKQSQEEADVDDMICRYGLIGSSRKYVAKYREEQHATTSVKELFAPKDSIASRAPLKAMHHEIKIGEKLIKRYLQTGSLRTSYERRNIGQYYVEVYYVFLSFIQDIHKAKEECEKAFYANETFNRFLIEGYCRENNASGIPIPEVYVNIIAKHTGSVLVFSDDDSDLKVICAPAAILASFKNDGKEHSDTSERRGRKYTLRYPTNDPAHTLYGKQYTDTVKFWAR